MSPPSLSTDEGALWRHRYAAAVGLVLSVAQVVTALNTDLVGAATFDAMLGVGILAALVYSQKNKA